MYIDLKREIIKQLFTTIFMREVCVRALVNDNYREKDSGQLVNCWWKKTSPVRDVVNVVFSLSLS